jgi:hypothetical protein
MWYSQDGSDAGGLPSGFAHTAESLVGGAQLDERVLSLRKSTAALTLASPSADAVRDAIVVEASALRVAASREYDV